MKKIQVAFALVAVFAFAAVTASGASAVEYLLAEYLVNGVDAANGTAAAIEGELLLEDMGTGTDILCSGKFIGTVSKNGEDEITLVEGLSAEDNVIDCFFTAKGSCEEANGSLVNVTAVNLPWATLLELEEPGGGFVILILPHAGGAAPGYLVECKVLGFKVDDTCTGETGAQAKNITGGVESAFLEGNATVTPPGNCSVGGNGQGLLNGSGTFTSPAGLSVSSV